MASADETIQQGNELRYREQQAENNMHRRNSAYCSGMVTEQRENKLALAYMDMFMQNYSVSTICSTYGVKEDQVEDAIRGRIAALKLAVSSLAKLIP